ncbi:MAG TPA: hypothetical protein VKZ58_10690 [Longimicrobiales bacterium]|nr:hypothetical protein [Longimicrobiales bacterium]
MILPEWLEAMLRGPGRLRFIIQPLAAILLGIRDGRRDARAGRPPYVFAVLIVRELRREALASGLGALTKPLIVAILVDMVVQYLIFRSVHLWSALVVGAVLVALPYVVSRALTNRVARRRGSGRGTGA